MSLTFEASATGCILRLEGEVDVTCAAELKRMLIEAISSRQDVQVDFAHATDLDVTAIQLLWAANREAEKVGVPFAVVGDVPENILDAACEAGLENFPVALIPKVAEPKPALLPPQVNR